MMHHLFPSATITALLMAAGCTAEAQRRSHVTLDARAEPLRAAFNRDVGKTRVLMLVAPT